MEEMVELYTDEDAFEVNDVIFAHCMRNIEIGNKCKSCPAYVLEVDECACGLLQEFYRKYKNLLNKQM